MLVPTSALPRWPQHSRFRRRCRSRSGRAPPPTASPTGGAVAAVGREHLLLAEGESRADRGPEIPGFPPGSPFEQFFRDFLDRNRPRSGAARRRTAERRPPPDPAAAVSLGSGFIIDPAGYIVTNNHVIEGADEITVTLTDDTKLKAKLIGKDERVDLALLKVESRQAAPAVQFGDSDTARVGDWVLAIGNPFGLGGSVTAGIVSRARPRHPPGSVRRLHPDRRRDQPRQLRRPAVQHGRQVIGINTAIYSPSGGSIGIGFSIPANLAKSVVAQLERVRPRRGAAGSACASSRSRRTSPRAWASRSRRGPWSPASTTADRPTKRASATAT